ncbi:hypothetical protein N5D77_18160 [Comamonas thiooxydans]|uniref:Uncharacterized protein n=1 Tax=Comamonas thiooxydans TaxID=363952 RepID=A0AA42Q2L8_9BURK|nr:hypothetical protein [Comamonas thiooxydans]MDH1335847.1 hypothetical protein [Comamonas thiooxydans]MDH1743609.1 hypothetical protein [Comamonas thiooxydans]MDH1788498.1 hypothetical protein [Comamonas thiooxydans]
MSKANFTRGPWQFRSESGYCSQIDGADGSVICCFDEDPKPEDASLMESAPDLYKALEESQSLLAAMLHESRPRQEIEAQMHQNRSAINKAQRAAQTDQSAG